MSTTVNGSSGITFPDSSTQASSQVGMKNRIIDGGFILNQRGYVSGTSLSAGTYAHDRWKAGSGGCTYTFTQGALGVNTTITITAGTLVQVIEGCNLAEGGTYVLSWTGTAQGRLNGGSYGASGSITVTGWTAGSNLNVEFNTGTLGNVQLEKGSTATSFDYRPYGTELALCQRYYQRVDTTGGNQRTLIGVAFNSTEQYFLWSFQQKMRAGPTVTMPSLGNVLKEGVAWYTPTGYSIISSAPDFVNITATLSSSAFSQGNTAFWGQNTNTLTLSASAEL